MAAAVPGRVLEDLDGRVERLLDRLPGARWTEGDSRHITLKFLGPTRSEWLPEVLERCRAVAAGGARGELRIEGLGAFPRPARASVLWAGVADPAGMLARLAGELDDLFGAMGYRAEKRPFTAHVTLARFRAPTRLELPPLEPLESFRLEHIGLFRSHLSPRGARYEPLASWPLGGLDPPCRGGPAVREEVEEPGG